MEMKPPHVKPRRVAARSAKERAQDDLVMQTNSSSIVSKRSVERIYYPDEPHYFRYFVKKFQRRAPLINRGYHLRLHVIDVAVRRFLERPAHKTKVVVNLGCGSDVLPWQCMTRYPDACRGAKFVDIDFPDLMSKKRTIVLTTPELRSVFEPVDTNVDEHVLLKSHMYSQIGCDLRNTADVEKALSTCLDLEISDCIFMFVAEVSITYMETVGADAVIKWASSLGQAEFCLLEQILPDGSDHPFAKTMLSHFDKLKTPLKSVFQYPHLGAQHDRFSRLGWPHVEAVSLWDVWTNDQWISATKRRELDLVEPFDEWEEFALFASHYCVVIARTSGPDVNTGDNNVPIKHSSQNSSPELLFNAYSGTHGKRRFGAAMLLQDELGEQIVANTFGLGTNNRLKSCDLYSFDLGAAGIKTHHVGPHSRVCHSVVDLGYFGSLLVGGRSSPSSAMRDCWHFSKEQNMWSLTDALPVPLYRHSTVQLGKSGMTLLIGGKSDSSTVFPGCLLHKPGSGWTECGILGLEYQPVFGAMLISFTKHKTIQDGSDGRTVLFDGILAGGLLEDGTVARQLLRWHLRLSADNRPTISFGQIESSADTKLLVSRFGASALLLDDERIAVVGGVQHDGIVPRADEVLIMHISDSKLEILSHCSFDSTSESSSIPRPLLVGASVCLGSHNQVLVMGGGATCFSMGTYWNEGCYTLNLNSLSASPATALRNSLKFVKLVELTDRPQPTQNGYAVDARSQQASITEIPKIRVDTEDDFERILRAGKPAIIEGSDLGTCVSKWTGAYLTENVGSQRKVVVHEASSSTMDFNAKNFSYITKDFASFIKEVEPGGKQYLRALSSEHPSDLPGTLEADFPGIAGDFQLPAELSFVKRNEHSSVLRISGRVNMWLHYDVMANVYCQISGSKKLLLFPPDDVSHLSFAPGASSSSIDVFSNLETPALAMTHPHEATLNPGDILFLPPLWLHATAPLTDFGVAVNIFFRNLETGYASGRDVYGNRDIAAYEKGRQDVARIANSFGKLPRDMQAFYMRRLADEMVQNIAI
ncbi:leucine carboxyl methyltransferase [Xylaria bambusicola]|uniref:leucine carboxyl methyltransferase n=1 Tax=Xylaria bambusicola TaxID=326684 RepID=UPI002008351B|nr:leucine carboxyl methyltransferase [Xylaria bambusicola]KAI0518568.1 leucine carboxyl methyltransferase [Xylaria bambusicola]